MSKFLKLMLVSVLFSFSSDLLPAAAARQAAVRMAVGMSAVAVGMKMAQVHQRQKAVKRQTEQLELVNAFQEEDWQKFRWYPNAAQEVKNIFEKRGRSPQEFNFEFVEGGQSSHLKTTFAEYIEEDEDGDDSFKITIFTSTFRYTREFIEGLERKQTLSQEHLAAVGIIGHELQHAFDEREIVGLDCLYLYNKNLLTEQLRSLSFFQKLFTHKSSQLRKALQENEQDNLNRWRALERKADLNASEDPLVLRAMAGKMNRYNAELEQKCNQKVREDFFSYDTHPHPLERARYLRELADQLEAAQKLAEQKLQQEKENCLMLSN